MEQCIIMNNLNNKQKLKRENKFNNEQNIDNTTRRPLLRMIRIKSLDYYINKLKVMTITKNIY